MAHFLAEIEVTTFPVTAPRSNATRRVWRVNVRLGAGVFDELEPLVAMLVELSEWAALERGR